MWLIWLLWPAGLACMYALYICCCRQNAYGGSQGHVLFFLYSSAIVWMWGYINYILCYFANHLVDHTLNKGLDKSIGILRLCPKAASIPVILSLTQPSPQKDPP
jgi:hypothetical protein